MKHGLMNPKENDASRETKLQRYCNWIERQQAAAEATAPADDAQTFLTTGEQQICKIVPSDTELSAMVSSVAVNKSESGNLLLIDFLTKVILLIQICSVQY